MGGLGDNEFDQSNGRDGEVNRDPSPPAAQPQTARTEGAQHAKQWARAILSGEGFSGVDRGGHYPRC